MPSGSSSSETLKKQGEPIYLADMKPADVPPAQNFFATEVFTGVAEDAPAAPFAQERRSPRQRPRRGHPARRRNTGEPRKPRNHRRSHAGRGTSARQNRVSPRRRPGELRHPRARAGFCPVVRGRGPALGPLPYRLRAAVPKTPAPALSRSPGRLACHSRDRPNLDGRRGCRFRRSPAHRAARGFDRPRTLPRFPAHAPPAAGAFRRLRANRHRLELMDGRPARTIHRGAEPTPTCFRILARP